MIFLLALVLFTNCYISFCHENALSIEKKLESIEEMIREKDDKINSLESLLKKQNEEISNLKDTPKHQNEEILELKKTIKLLDRQRPVSTKLNNCNDSNLLAKQHGKSELKRLTGQTQTSVAFFARMTTQRTYHAHESLNFTEEIDIGGGFNAADSIYDVPVSGIYVFTWTILPNYYDYIQTELIVNGVVKGVMVADSDEIHDLHPSTGVILVHANKGNHVYLRQGHYSSGRILVDETKGTTSFAGWLLIAN